MQEEYKPITPIGYIGYQLLFSIPIIGLIFLIVYACGGSGNINVKNYARSFILMYVISFVLIFILVFFFGVLDTSTNSQISDYLNNLFVIKNVKL